MSLIPAFEIGLWNAWWFMIVFHLQWLAILIIPGHFGERTGDVPGQGRIVVFLTTKLHLFVRLRLHHVNLYECLPDTGWSHLTGIVRGQV